jgi:hypothetical protein
VSAAVDSVGALTAAQPETRARRRASWWSWGAILTLAAAGGLHLLVAAAHVDHSSLVVSFFLAVAAGQIGAAGLLFVLSRPGLRPRAGLLAAGIAGTMALIGLYLVAHRTGLFADILGQSSPVGHQHGGTGHPVETGGLVALDQPVVQPEQPGALDAAVLGAEVLSVVALTALLPRTWRGRTVDALCALGALTWVLWLTGVLA